MGDAATEAKAPYCTEYQNVNAEATWTERVCTYPGRSDDMLAEGGAQPEAATTCSDTGRYRQKSAEAVVVGKPRRAEC